MKTLVCRRLGDEQAERLRGMGLSLRILPNERAACPAEWEDAEAIVCHRFFDYHDIAGFASLKYIQTTSAGIDHLPLDYISEHGIELHNARGVLSAPMAEFALCGVLQLYKHMPAFQRHRRERIWCQDMHLLELSGKRVCIIGTGSVGTEAAMRFSAMGCHVTGICRHPLKKMYFDEMHATETMDKALSESDIVVLSLPLTDETRGLFDAERLARMKKGAVLVNIARGAIVETSALCDALRNKSLMGAVVDVFEKEPLPPDSPLWDMENVILTPHNSFSGDGNEKRMFECIYNNLKDYIARTQNI